MELTKQQLDQCQKIVITNLNDFPKVIPNKCAIYYKQWGIGFFKDDYCLKGLKLVTNQIKASFRKTEEKHESGRIRGMESEQTNESVLPIP